MYWTAYSESFPNTNRNHKQMAFCFTVKEEREKWWWSAFGLFLKSEIGHRWMSTNRGKTSRADDYGSHCAYLFSESRKKMVLVKPIKWSDAWNMLSFDPRSDRGTIKGVPSPTPMMAISNMLIVSSRTRTLICAAPRTRTWLHRRQRLLRLVWSRKTVSDTHLMAPGPVFSLRFNSYTWFIEFRRQYMNIIRV